MSTSGKIYTKTGDKGKTSLVDGQRVEKSHPLLESYGTVDELNSLLGLALCEELPERVSDSLSRIQHELFALGSQLACPNEEMRKQLPAINESHCQRLEAEMDQMSEELPPLKEFILPGGTRASALVHVARTICRRAERELYLATEQEKLGLEPPLFQYLNRLSDWLFVSARYLNFSFSQPDVTWKKESET